MLAVPVILLGACAAEKSDSEYVQQGRQFHEQNQWRAALIEYKNALQKNPANQEARSGLGMIYLEAGDGAAAEKELRRAVELGMNSAQAAFPIASAMLLQRQFEKIVTEFSGPAAVTQTPQNASAELRGVIAEALLGQGKFELAQAELDRALTVTPITLPVMLSAARIAAVGKNLPVAQDWLRRALELAPKDPSAWLMKGDLASASSRHADAAAAYQSALDHDQRQLPTQRNARARVGLAFALLAQDQVDAAIPHIELLLKANPKSFFGNYLRGLAAFKKAEYPTALDYLQRSAQDAPPGSPAMKLLGTVNYAMANFQQADLYLTKYVDAAGDDLAARKLLSAVRLKLQQPETVGSILGRSTANSSDAQILTLMGDAAAMRGDFREGRDYFSKALKVGNDGGAIETRLAQTYMAEGDYDRALAHLGQATKDSGEALRAKVLMVGAHIRKNDTAAALKAAQALVAEFPQNPDMHNILGGVYLAIKDASKARAAFESALALQPKQAPTLLNLATLDWNEKKMDAARAGFLHVLEADPKNVTAMVWLARMEQAEGHEAAALEWLEKGRLSSPEALEPRVLLGRHYLERGTLPKAEELANELVKAKATPLAALSLIGDVQWAMRQYPAAAETYEGLVKSYPKNPGVHLRLGQVRAEMQQLPQARASVRQALTLEANFFTAVSTLAFLEMRLSNPTAANQVVNDYIKRQPKDAQGYALRGDVLSEQKSFDAAVAAYAQAEKLKPSSALVIKRYQAASRGSKPAASMQILHDWLKTNPKDDAVRLVLADSYRILQRNAEAIALYEALLVEKPGQVVVLNNLALIYLATKDPRALETAESAYKKSSDHPYIADTYGWVLLQTGNAAKGREILEQAVTKLPEQPDIQTHLAVALEATGEPMRAREVLEKVLREKREFELRSLAEQVMARLKVSP